MTKLVQARLDEESLKLLQALRRKTGLSDSELVRRGLAALSEAQAGSRRKRIHGLGRFASGRSDLGSDKRHLAGFGRK